MPRPILAVVRASADAARRALEAGFGVAEIHGAHGCLLHRFLSPLSHHCTDDYGGDVTPEQADQILVNQAADAVMPARELLRNPHWPLTAARVLGHGVAWPPQYARARCRR